MIYENVRFINGHDSADRYEADPCADPFCHNTHDVLHYTDDPTAMPTPMRAVRIHSTTERARRVA